MVQPLSEKAKGKQRADTILDDVLDRGNPPPPRELMVRFTDGVQDLTLHVSDHDLVRDVKAKVRPFPFPSLPPSAQFCSPSRLTRILHFSP
jgi:hypothetical protein